MPRPQLKPKAQEPFEPVRGSKSKYAHIVRRRREKRTAFHESLDKGFKKMSALGLRVNAASQEGILEQAFKYALMGSTNAEIAALLGLSTGEDLDADLMSVSGLTDAIFTGRDMADANVAKGLYHRAIGYSHPAVKIFFDKESGEVVQVPYTEYYPPDTGAALKWLASRRRTRPNNVWMEPKEETQTQIMNQVIAPVIVINPVSSSDQARLEEQQLAPVIDMQADEPSKG